MSMSKKKEVKLTRLLSRCDWKGVFERLLSAPEQARLPIPTKFDNIVYPLHQAVCMKKKGTIPDMVLQLLIKSYPKALDCNVFVGACENDEFTADSMKVLFEMADDATYFEVQRESHDLTILMMKAKNTEIVQMFIDRFPFILNGPILIEAIKHSSVQIVDLVLAAGRQNSVGLGAGGVFVRHKGINSNALEVATELLDTNDQESCKKLVACIHYANTSRLKLGDPNQKPDFEFPIVVAAVGWVPRHVFANILEMHYSRVRNHVAISAIHKLMHLSYEKQDHNQIPEIFADRKLRNACKERNSVLVHEILVKNFAEIKSKGDEIKFIDRTDKTIKNALNLAVKLYKDDNSDSRKVLQSCVKFINAVKMDLRFPNPHTYPTLLAAIGLVPQKVLISISKRFKAETKTNSIGKAAIKKTLILALEEGNNPMFATRLDERHMFPLHIDTRRVKMNLALSIIHEVPYAELDSSIISKQEFQSFVENPGLRSSIFSNG